MRSAIERFMDQVSPEPNSGCWLWAGTCSGAGYGVFPGVWGKGAHRAALHLLGPGMPSNLMALHRCDNPACVNPDHLYAGTCLDNVADMSRRGRIPHAFVTPSQAIDMGRWAVAAWNGGSTVKELAAMIGVHQVTLGDWIRQSGGRRLNHGKRSRRES